MINSYILLPAYGRKYASMDLMIADYKAGKDFKLAGIGTYCSNRDFNNNDMLTNVYLKYDDSNVINVKDIK